MNTIGKAEENFATQHGWSTNLMDGQAKLSFTLKGKRELFVAKLTVIGHINISPPVTTIL